MNFRQCKPVTIRGITYPSMNEAARDLGVNPKTVYTAAARGMLNHIRPKSDTGRWAEARPITRRCEPVRNNDPLTAASMNIRTMLSPRLYQFRSGGMDEHGAYNRKHVSLPFVSILGG